MRRPLLLAAAVLALAGPAAAGPRILGGGGTGAPPFITFSPLGLTAPVASGTPAGTATISGLSGGAWSISPTSSFNVNASTGDLTTSTVVGAGTYTPTLTYTDLVSGQTITVSLAANIVVSPGPNNPAQLFFPYGTNLLLPAAVF